VHEILAKSNKAREWNKENTNRKERSQITPICRRYDPVFKSFLKTPPDNSQIQ
jgi:hypothetical protein